MIDERALYGAGVAVFNRLDCGVLWVEFSGPLTPLVLERFRADVARRGDETKAGAAVLCLQTAVVALDRRAAPAATMLGLPIAMVVAPAMLADFKAYAWDMAQRGYLRGIFTDVSPALAWARTKVGLARRVL